MYCRMMYRCMMMYVYIDIYRMWLIIIWFNHKNLVSGFNGKVSILRRDRYIYIGTQNLSPTSKSTEIGQLAHVATKQHHAQQSLRGASGFSLAQSCEDRPKHKEHNANNNDDLLVSLAEGWLPAMHKRCSFPLNQGIPRVSLHLAWILHIV